MPVMKDSEIEQIRSEYEQVGPSAARLVRCLTDQICELLESHGISLGVPIESRVKTLISIEEKLERKSLSTSSVVEMDDFVGIRIILLFKDDLIKVGEILKTNFDILSYEDTSTRLLESQFGYQSDHFILRIKEDWEDVPTFRGLRTLKAEVQVRTMAQHIWAAASHKLQYKQEANIPSPLRRSIHRVSALLETVDLELNRVNIERNEYISTVSKVMDSSISIDVDTLAKVLAEQWSPKNLSPSEEEYDSLVSELRYFEITTVGQLREFIKQFRDEILAHEKETVERMKLREDLSVLFKERVSNGYYFTQVALTRIALRRKFGEDIANEVIRCGGRPISEIAPKQVPNRRRVARKRKSAPTKK